MRDLVISPRRKLMIIVPLIRPHADIGLANQIQTECFDTVLYVFWIDLAGFDDEHFFHGIFGVVVNSDVVSYRFLEGPESRLVRCHASVGDGWNTTYKAVQVVVNLHRCPVISRSVRKS